MYQYCGIGNHDITLDSTFYSQHWSSFHNQAKQDEEACRALLQDSATITYLQHNSAHIKLSSPTGPQTHFKVFGSPYSPAHGLWAFGYKPTEAGKLWNDIPPDTDILVTHTPPKNHCDVSVTKTRSGCEPLRQALWRVRPYLAVCGHMHEGRGAEIIKWHAGLPTVKFLEEAVEFWEDPGAGQGNRKQSLLNLSAKSWNKPLNNPPPRPSRLATNAAFSGEGEGILPSGKQVGRLADMDSYRKSLKANLGGGKKATLRGLAERSEKDEGPHGARYSGGEAEASESRAETCVVNAAILANSWGGPKRFNKPIVVDLDLPVWSGSVDENGCGE